MHVEAASGLLLLASTAAALILANAGVAFSLPDFGEPVALAITAHLVPGKPRGITVMDWLRCWAWGCWLSS
jgi:Na+/H+ antiporter NhaA